MNLGGWQNVEVSNSSQCALHCVPVDDLRIHYLDFDGTCWCHPREDNDKADFWIHNSMDRRERYEEEGGKLN